MVDHAGQTCGKPHTQHRCFSRLDDAWRAEFGDEVERPHWAELLRSRVAIFDLDFDAILSAMYALSTSVEGVCYRCVPPDPDIEAAALGASESSLPGTAPAKALHTFTLDSGASRCFFCDSTTLTPLPAPVPVKLADPSGGPIIARSTSLLPCPAVLSGSLSGLHLPLFSTNLVSTTALQDSMVTTTSPGGQHVSICMCTQTGRHLTTFIRRPGSSLYTLATESPQVAASAQVSACLPPLPPSPAPPCLPCVEGQQRAAPHSSSFPPTTAPLQTLHMDVRGPARVSGQGRERYFLLVVDDYTRYITVFPLCSKGQVVDVLVPWIRAVRLQLRERFGQDQPVLRLHSDRGGEFSFDLLRDLCCGEGITQSITLSASPQQNGIAEHRIGLVMEVARTSMIHAAAPHFLWPFAVQNAAHQVNLWPRVSLPETSPTLRWTGEVGDASVFRDVTFDESVPIYRLFPYRSAPPPPPLLFLAPGPPPIHHLPPQSPAPSGVSQVDPLPGVVPVEVAGDTAEPGGAECEGVGSGVAESGGAEPRGAEPGGVEPRVWSPGVLSLRESSLGALSLRVRSLGVLSLGWLVRRARLRSGAAGAGATGDTGDTRAGGAGVTAGAGGTGGTAVAGLEGARTKGTGAAVTGGVGGAGAGDPTEPGAAGAGATGASGAGARGAGAGGTGAGGAGAGEAGAVDPKAGVAGAGGASGTGAGGTVRPRPYFVALLQQVLGFPSSTYLTPPLLCPQPDQSQPPLQPASPLPSPSPYTEQSDGLTECHEPASCPVSPVRTPYRIPRSRPPPVPGTHAMALRPSSVPLRVLLPPPPESSLPAVPDHESDLVRAASVKKQEWLN
ncbi:unnamed protein product [Closterium sp. NIES-54]